MIKAFGGMKFYDPDEDLCNFQTLIIESNTDGGIFNAQLCKSLFMANKTIGFIEITEKYQNVLADCTGEKLNLIGKNIFVCPLKTTNADDKKFAFTIIPNYTSTELLDEYEHKKKKIFLEIQHKFRVNPLTASGPYKKPPTNLTQILFPVGNYQAICGSWTTPFSKTITFPLTSFPNIGSGSQNIDLTMQVELEVKAYVLWSGKNVGGDDNYHVIFHSELSAVFPTACYTVWYQGIGFPSPAYYVFYYGLTIYPQIPPGRNYKVAATQPGKDAVSMSSDYGYNIYTQFGLPTKYPVTIQVESIQNGGIDQGVGFQPNFNSIINQVIFPNIINYESDLNNSATVSSVNFTAVNDDGEDLTTNGKFEMISYFVIDGVVGETNFPVNFSLNLDFFGDLAGDVGYGKPQLDQSISNSFVLDLAKMSKMQKYYSPPQNNQNKV